MPYLRELVDTPRPLPAPFGLVNAKTLVSEPASSHWENGFTYEITNAGLYAQTHDACDYTAAGGVSVGTAPGAVDSDGAEMWVDYAPFAIEATDGCRTSAGLNASDRQDRARAALELLTPKVIEREFWANAYTNTAATYGNRSLKNQTPVLPLGTTAVKPRRGIAALEWALAQEGAGYTGAIHVTRDVFSMLSVEMLATQDADGIMWTPGGNMLIGGVGYTGDGPSPRTTGHSWAYATGPVSVRLSPVQVNDVPSQIEGPEGLETFFTNNTLVYTAERFAAVTFNGVNVYAVLIDLDG